ncbi:glycosyltransferase [Pontibacter fetidus]|uniref:Glycosyltransferase n=1 Tax=Pontibacter fetidus TaxID=2700082 RepID=A0A6B2GXB1_9BACT|nr:glycosyltransferase [Pontibacter fetidus]NDK55589.1 glycosyltransferase [Pontibacter fetidus]
MKIAFFFRRLNQGGIQRMILNCAEYLAHNGHDISVILIKKEGEYLDILDPKVRLITFGNTKANSLYKSFKAILENYKFDILFTASPPLNIFAIVCKLLTGTRTKIVISERNNTLSLFLNNRLSFSKVTFLGIPLFYRFADSIVAVSKGLSQRLATIALIPEKRINTIYNPAYTDSLSQHMHDTIDHPWLVFKQQPVLVNVARLTKAKNHLLLIRAVARVLKNRNIKLLIVGDGPLKEMLQQEINQLGLQEHIELVGFQLNPVSWIAKADLFVLSSDYEGFGNVIVEALATGITIVSTNCDFGPPEIINNGEFGYLAAVGSEEDLAAQIEHALDNPMAKEKQIKRAKDFHVDLIMQKYNDLFASLTVS